MRVRQLFGGSCDRTGSAPALLAAVLAGDRMQNRIKPSTRTPQKYFLPHLHVVCGFSGTPLPRAPRHATQGPGFARTDRTATRRSHATDRTMGYDQGGSGLRAPGLDKVPEC